MDESKPMTRSLHDAEVLSASSSAQNSDIEDEDTDMRPGLSYKERRRERHTLAEQKRRDAIKKGYDELQELVPSCQQADSVSGQKLSKAAVLQKSLDYISFLVQQRDKQAEELAALRKEVMALKIMKNSYENIVKVHHNTPATGEELVSEEDKLKVFTGLMDGVFSSFDASVRTSSFQELSASVFTWLEDQCNPQSLREVALKALSQQLQPGAQ